MTGEFMPLMRPAIIAAALIALGALLMAAQATSITPEPASLLLLGSGLAAVGATIRRRRARATGSGKR